MEEERATSPQTFCIQCYLELYQASMERLAASENAIPAEKREAVAQKAAIEGTFARAIEQYPNEEPSYLWKIIYGAHVHRRSGINDEAVITNVISADQSWKKSSGHAFEEFVKNHASEALRDQNIEIVLQRDLNDLIRRGMINNEPRDIDWLQIQIQANIFDLYAIVSNAGRRCCYGCIQSKTSIRDRVTRDREPSIAAMNMFFWSTIVTLDGDFLRLPKFNAMVNGGSDEFPNNGWHGMYVLSDQFSDRRIYPIDIHFSLFKEHAVQAAAFWLSQRQWFRGDWQAT